MRGYGCTVVQIAVEMARRFGLRPRVAWRYALGWPQWKVTQEYNTRPPGAKVADNRISEYEADAAVWAAVLGSQPPGELGPAADDLPRPLDDG
ncbi:MAG TPA: hypothetical protein VFQ77_08140 [Pseudonocardiaceae bacterium]|jgi:hypothetical protein|nr:hypothetical protein [Pseudonocardiaceae bacterium]